MAWIITRDYYPDTTAPEGTNANAKGVRSADCTEEASRSCFWRFRMLDDDGDVYYEGNSTTRDEQAAFAPLDDFGAPNAGCTSIEYFRTTDGRGGHWEVL